MIPHRPLFVLASLLVIMIFFGSPPPAGVAAVPQAAPTPPGFPGEARGPGKTIFSSPATEAGRAPSKGQTLYVPAYSQITHGRANTLLLLAATLTVRNLASAPITIESVEYRDSDGKLARAFLAEPLTVPAWAAKSFFIEEKDVTGGAAAHFQVRWRSPKPVPPPLAETVMIGSASSLGVSFTGQGVVLEEARQ